MTHLAVSDQFRIVLELVVPGGTVELWRYAFAPVSESVSDCFRFPIRFAISAMRHCGTVESFSSPQLDLLVPWSTVELWNAFCVHKYN